MPNPAHANRRELDYAISIYYFLTKTTGEDILYWCKYTGCFPTNIPSSNFADSVNETIKQPTYTISFNYSKKDDYNPLHVAEFNYLSQQQAFHYIPVYNQETHHSTRHSLVVRLLIQVMVGNYINLDTDQNSGGHL